MIKRLTKKTDKMPDQLNSKDLIETIGDRRNKKIDKQLAVQLVKSAKTNLKADKAIPKSKEDNDLQLLLDKATEGTEQLNTVERMMLQSFESLTERQKMNIISGFLSSHKREIEKEEKKEDKEDKELSSFKLTLAKVVVFTVLGLLIFNFGLFVYSVFFDKDLLPNAGFGATLNVLQEVFKIIFSSK